MKVLVPCFLLVVLSSSCTNDKDSHDIFLAQGIIVGEISDHRAIIQTRLTAVESLTDGHVPGKEGFVQFLFGTDINVQKDWQRTDIFEAFPENDFIVKTELAGLQAGQTYYYQVLYGKSRNLVHKSNMGSFRTNPGKESDDGLSFAVVTGMNYYHFHYGKYDATTQYMGEDKHLGYPALASILKRKPDYFIGTGDNVYFDHPAEGGFKRALERQKNPLPGLFDGKQVEDEAGMRRKYHVQFVQPRFVDLFAKVGTYWLKDDHDYRVNDSDPYMDFPISHDLGIKNFREQLPVVYPPYSDQPSYRTLRMSKDLQVWFPEGRDYRSPNAMEDGPDKSIWGEEQRTWIKQSLLESDATFKLFISATPMVGPDDAYKRDNHVNHEGFRYEGDAFFNWLTDNDFLDKGFYFVCGDRHWQYHAIHPSGFEEFSTGALVDANSRAGRLAGDKNSTDPDALIQQPYVQGKQEQATGGFLMVSTRRNENNKAQLEFEFYDEKGNRLYNTVRERK